MKVAVTIHKAHPTVDSIPDLHIEASQELPTDANDTTERVMRCFRADAERLVAAMQECLPGGTLHWLLIELLERKAETIGGAWRVRSEPKPVAMFRREDWHEDDGPVLWWRFPIIEPPYVGTPLDAEWPAKFPGLADLAPTHFTRLELPKAP